MPDCNVRYVAELELGAESAVGLVATATPVAARRKTNTKATRLNTVTRSTGDE
jgi:hypothetical protein